MARRSPPKNELQDPTLPYRRRARWRVIGAAVLAMAALVILPMALESEPKQSLQQVQIQLGKRASIEGRGWLDSTSSDIAPLELGSPMAAAGGDPAPTEIRVAPPRNVTLPVPPPPGEAAAVGSATPAQDAAGGRGTDGAKRQADAKPARPPDDKAGSAGAGKPEGKAPSPAAGGADKKDQAVAEKVAEAVRAAAKGADAPASQGGADAQAAAERNAAAAARASQRAAQAAAPEPTPPLPERRKDRNALQAASPSGFVVQIGAFSNMQGARTQVARARKLGFDAYTETIATRKGDRIRVRVGPYLTREQANVARAKLRAEGIDTVLIAP